MKVETQIRAILECNFAGFKDEIINVAVNSILKVINEPAQSCEGQRRVTIAVKEAMEEIEGIKEFPLTNKEAINLLKEELQSNRQNKEYSWQLDDAYKMTIVALAVTMTEEEKNILEEPKLGQGDNCDKFFCPVCGNTLWTIWQHFDRPDRCSVCGQLIDNQPFGGVRDDK